MVTTSIFIILAVGVLAFAVITQPLYDISASELKSEAIPQVESTAAAYQERLRWLHDLDIELFAGKIEQTDYAFQKAVLQAEADQLFAQLQALQQDLSKEGGQSIESMITDRRMERVERSAGFCVKCGTPLQRSDAFCPKCGLKLKQSGL
jgi:rRNA maturation endonuclease Nob1